MTVQTEAGRQGRVMRPTSAFVLSLASGISMVSFSSGLASYAQYYFITSFLVQNSFIVGLLTVFVGALLYQRPYEKTVWSLVMMTLAIDELVLVTSISSTIPLLQIPLTGLALGPIAGISALLSGIVGLRFRSV